MCEKFPFYTTLTQLLSVGAAGGHKENEMGNFTQGVEAEVCRVTEVNIT